MRLYAKEYPEERISDYERAKILKEMMTHEMQRDLVRLEKKGYDNIFQYVTSQAPLRRDEEMRRKGHAMPVHAVADKEIEPVDTLERAIEVLNEQGFEGNGLRPQGGAPMKGPMSSPSAMMAIAFIANKKGIARRIARNLQPSRFAESGRWLDRSLCRGLNRAKTLARATSKAAREKARVTMARGVSGAMASTGLTKNQPGVGMRAHRGEAVGFDLRFLVVLIARQIAVAQS